MTGGASPFALDPAVATDEFGRSLRRGYLGKEETGGAPRPPMPSGTTGYSPDDRGGFSFGGHRLPSLYRDADDRSQWLGFGKAEPFFFAKIPILAAAVGGAA